MLLLLDYADVSNVLRRAHQRSLLRLYELFGVLLFHLYPDSNLNQICSQVYHYDQCDVPSIHKFVHVWCPGVVFRDGFRADFGNLFRLPRIFRGASHSRLEPLRWEHTEVRLSEDWLSARLLRFNLRDEFWHLADIYAVDGETAIFDVWARCFWLIGRVSWFWNRLQPKKNIIAITRRGSSVSTPVTTSSRQWKCIRNARSSTVRWSAHGGSGLKRPGATRLRRRRRRQRNDVDNLIRFSRLPSSATRLYREGVIARPHALFSNWWWHWVVPCMS